MEGLWEELLGVSKVLRAADDAETHFSLLNSLLEEAAVTCSVLSPEMVFTGVVCY